MPVRRLPFTLANSARSPHETEHRFVMGLNKVNPVCTSVATRRPQTASSRTLVRRRQKGQSLVEFAISSLVLILLLMGLLDLSRAFYYSVNLQGAAREGARHGAWFDTATRTNKYLDDADLMLAVKQAMAGDGFDGTAGHLPIPTQVTSAGCLVGAD